MHRRLPALLAAALLVAACGADTPSGAPTGSGTPSATSLTGPAPSGFAGQPGDTSTELITAAYEAGRIDRATALLYRLQASVGDDRLPGEFRALTLEDDGAAAKSPT